MFEELRSKIFEIDENIIETMTENYVAYKVARNFSEITIGKNQLKIHLRPIEYVDPEGRVEKVPDTYFWTMNRRIYLKNVDELDYVFPIIGQSYRDVI